MEFWPGKRFSTHGLKVSLPNEDLAYNQLKSGLDSQTISHINTSTYSPVAKHHFLWQPGHRVHMGFFCFCWIYTCWRWDLKTTLCHLTRGSESAPAHFCEPKILKNFIIFWMQGYHISLFLFSRLLSTMKLEMTKHLHRSSYLTKI